jgi:YD repeat-containing protein
LEETGRYYQVDSAACQAEILKILRYPTGGETHFEYEIHHYGQVAGQYPFSLFEEIGVAGGLRIRKITDYSGDTVNERRFRYVDIGGASSGISAVKPRYDAEGSVTVGLEPQYIQESLSLFYYPDFSITLPYTFSGERRLNQIPLTGGCHVTYSRVEEWFPDSSKVVYCYTNHENNPDVPFIQAISSFNDWGLYNSFSSHSLSRGLLLKKEVYSKDCATPLSVEEYEYLRDSTDYVQGLNEITHCGGLLRRCAHILYYTYFPVLANKKVIVYPDNGGSPFIETTEYTYDSHRRLTGTTRRVGGVTERDTLTYTGNFTTGDYAGMAAHNMIAYPVEKVRFRKDTLQSEKVISADLTTWKRWGDRFVPSETYKANVGSGTAGTFRFYNGSRKDFKYLLEPEQRYVAYDSLGNILLTEDHAGVPTSYVWTPDGCHPAAVFTGAKVGYTKYIASDVARVLNYQLEPTEDVSLQFESVSSFTLRIWLTCPNNQCWDLAPVVDGTDYRIVCVNDPLAPSPWPANAVSYPSPLEIPLPAGIHSVSIRPSSHMYVVNSTDPATFSIEVDYKEKQVTEQQIAGHTVVFEDFEDEEGELVPEGYNSEKGHRGTWTHTLDASKGPYYVDYRVYRNGKWNYVRQRETGSSTSISEGFAPIDHVRIYPVDCLPESYTWYEDGTLRSKTDSRGVTESYDYDGLGRLVGVYDNDGKKVEGYEYNYQNR